jgi:hypothetical protein
VDDVRPLLWHHDDPPPTVAEQVLRRRLLELAPRCPHCGGPAPDGTVSVGHGGPAAGEPGERCGRCLGSSP